MEWLFRMPGDTMHVRSDTFRPVSPPLKVACMVQSDSDLICKVLSAMDYLKVRADHEQPTGEGVPLDIAIMADFGVGLDGPANERLNKLKGHPKGAIAAAEIGSRAGRVLSILAPLRDRDDDRLKLHYMALRCLVWVA